MWADLAAGCRGRLAPRTRPPRQRLSSCGPTWRPLCRGRLAPRIRRLRLVLSSCGPAWLASLRWWDCNDSNAALRGKNPLHHRQCFSPKDEPRRTSQRATGFEPVPPRSFQPASSAQFSPVVDNHSQVALRGIPAAAYRFMVEIPGFEPGKGWVQAIPAVPSAIPICSGRTVRTPISLGNSEVLSLLSYTGRFSPSSDG